MATDYGADLACVFTGGAGIDLDPTGALVTGTRAVAEAVARRLVTRRGSLLGDPDYGLDVRYFFNGSFGQADQYAFQRAVSTEAQKDERVLSARAVATLAENGTLTVDVDIDSDQGPFGLVLAPGDVTVVKLKET